MELCCYLAWSVCFSFGRKKYGLTMSPFVLKPNHILSLTWTGIYSDVGFRHPLTSQVENTGLF